MKGFTTCRTLSDVDTEKCRRDHNRFGDEEMKGAERDCRLDIIETKFNEFKQRREKNIIVTGFIMEANRTTKEVK